MIFAHGPFGFLSSFLTKPLWSKVSKKHRKNSMYWSMAFGILGGLFPDIDLFYYYLFNASASHRGFITHTPFLYLSIAFVLIVVFWLIKKPIGYISVLAYTSGALSHLLADSIGAQIQWLYPFSHHFYGISSFSHEFITSNALYLNFLFEGIVFFFFFYVLIRLFSKRRVVQYVLIGVLLLTWMSATTIITYGNQYIYHGKIVIPYNDNDADRIPNYQDRDMDGDGINNIDDLDSDQNGKSNVEEMIEHAEEFTNVWYDKTEGGFLQIPARLGLVTNDDIVRRLYATIGIFVTTEMQADYQQNFDGYILSPAETNFDRNNMNIYTWLSHIGRLETEESFTAGRNQIGDILFFENGHIGIVSGFTNMGEDQILDVHVKRGIAEVSMNQIIQWEGKPIARGKMLNSDPLFQTILE